MPRRAPTLLTAAALFLAAVLSSCRDGSTPIAPEVEVRLEVTMASAPAWADLFASSEVDGLRAVAVSETGQDLLGSLETAWASESPSGSTALDVTVRDGGPFAVTVLVELLDGTEVVWSGRSDPTEVTATPFPVAVTLHRGPLANLSVTDLEIGAPPPVLDEGTSTPLTAEVTTDDAAALPGVRVFWVSTDPDIAAVDADGLVTAVAPGTVSILAVAGSVGDTATMSVEAAPTGVILDPPSARLTSLLEQLTVEATVVDARGDTLGGHALVWESTDSTVLVPSGGGVFEAAAEGEAEVVASVAEAPTVAGRAAVAVEQVISSVAVAPSDTVVLGPGSAVPFTAEALDARGSVVAGASFTWSSSEPSVATVDAWGMVTTMGQGVTSIEATTEGASASVDLTVLTTAGYSGVWVGGDPGGGRDWSNQNNWLPRRVPTVTDTVLVPADAAEQPRLTSDRSVSTLVVENGAWVDLDGFMLTLAQDLDAGSGLVGPGRVRMIGAGASIRGALPALMVHGVVEAAGSVAVTGDLVVEGAGTGLNVGSHEVAVTGALRVRDGAMLTMQNPSGVLDVDGEAVFDGAPTLGLLSDGVLRVGGNFTAWTSHPQNFAPTGDHTTVLDGAVVQVVYLHHSGPDESRFRDLEVDNAGGVTLSSTLRVDDVTLTSGTLGGAQTVVLSGDLTEVMGGNQYQVLNTTFTGTPALPGSLQTNATFTTAYSLGQDLEFVGDVFVDGSGATLDIGARTVRVTGDFRTAAGGTLTMQDAAGVLDVEGEAEFNGGSTLGLLTGGELRVAGDFTAWTSHPENFAPTGAHRTILDGTGEQTVYLYHSGADQARFEDLVVTNTVEAVFAGTVRVTDALTVSTALRVDAGAVALVAGLFTLEATATLTNEGSVQANDCQLLGIVVGNAPICP